MENRIISGTNEEIEFSQLLKVLWQRKLMIFVLTLITLAGSIFLNYYAFPPIYEGKVVLMVAHPSEQQEYAIGENKILETLAKNLAALPQMNLETYVGQLKNERLLESLVKDLKLDEEKYTLKHLMKNITVDIVADTNLMEIKVKDTNPAQAALMANTLSQNFLDFISEKSKERMQQSQRIFREQIALIEKELVLAKKKLNDFLGQPRSISYLEEELRAQQEALTSNQRALAQSNNKTYYTRIINQLEADIEQSQSELLNKQWEYQRLIQEVERLEENYNLFANQITQTQLYESIDIGRSNIMVVTTAMEPNIAVSPKKERNIVISLGVALLLGVALAFVLELFQNKIRDTEDVKHYLGLPVIGKIPRIVSKSKSKNQYLIAFLDPKSPEAEAFRTLRTNLYYDNLAHGFKKVLVTSAGPAEGKSTVIANLAIVLAKTGKKVLLIDADLRKPILHNIFEVNNSVGLSNYLREELSLWEMIQETKIEKLDVITGGQIPINPSELLGSEKIDKLFSAIEDYDYIFLDTPPALTVTDASIIGEKVDAIIIILNSNKVPVELAQQTVELLEKSKTKIIGVILNNVRYKKDYYRYYYYGDGK